MDRALVLLQALKTVQTFQQNINQAPLELVNSYVALNTQDICNFQCCIKVFIFWELRDCLETFSEKDFYFFGALFIRDYLENTIVAK